MEWQCLITFIQILNTLHYPNSPQVSLPNLSRSLNMSSAVDHIVLLKLREPIDLPDHLTDLKSLKVVLYLAAGPLLHQHPQFSHFIHVRFASKADLDTYNNHPYHLAVIADLNPITDDLLFADWLADFGQLVVPPPGSVLRVSLLKLKDGVDVKEVLEKLTSKATVQVTKGENLSKAWKGFQVGLLEVFSCVEEMEGTESIDESVRELAENIVVVDFAKPEN